MPEGLDGLAGLDGPEGLEGPEGLVNNIYFSCTVLSSRSVSIMMNVKLRTNSTSFSSLVWRGRILNSQTPTIWSLHHGTTDVFVTGRNTLTRHLLIFDFGRRGSNSRRHRLA